MVLESVVADLLNRFLGDYVENLNKSQLKLGIWGGKPRQPGSQAGVGGGVGAPPAPPSLSRPPSCMARPASEVGVVGRLLKPADLAPRGSWGVTSPTDALRAGASPGSLLEPQSCFAPDFGGAGKGSQ